MANRRLCDSKIGLKVMGGANLTLVETSSRLVFLGKK
jgi:hypothetical protein